MCLTEISILLGRSEAMESELEKYVEILGSERVDGHEMHTY